MCHCVSNDIPACIGKMISVVVWFMATERRISTTATPGVIWSVGMLDVRSTRMSEAARSADMIDVVKSTGMYGVRSTGIYDVVGSTGMYAVVGAGKKLNNSKLVLLSKYMYAISTP